MKVCTGCFLEKEYSAYPKSSRSKDGYYPRCKECKNSTARAEYAKDPVGHNEYNRAIYAADPERAREVRKASRDRNLTSTRQSRRAWRVNNPGKVNSLTAAYRADKLQATPRWLTADQKGEITSFYLIAKDLQWLSEEPLEVDHIVPLRGNDVSGLHVPWNLQILPKSGNRCKSNRAGV